MYGISDGKDFIEGLNPNSQKVIQTVAEPSLAAARADDKFQFERHGYFVVNRVDPQRRASRCLIWRWG